MRCPHCGRKYKANGDFYDEGFIPQLLLGVTIGLAVLAIVVVIIPLFAN